MPSITYAQYCKLAKIDSSKTSEKNESKKMKEMSDLSMDDLFKSYGTDSLSIFSVNDLKDELKSRGLSYQGVKSELISRLEESLSSHKRKSPERHSSKDTKHQKTETSTMDVDLDGKNPGNVAGGYKATLKNPNVSEEAKENAKKQLDSMGEDETPKSEKEDFDLKESLKGKHKGNVIGGYKATLHNPNSSEEAKQHAQQVLKEMGVDADEKAERKDRSEPAEEEGDDQTVDEMETIDVNNKRVIGGYKATIHNENSSEEAKEHARKILKKLGVDPEEKEPAKQKDDEEKNPGNVIGGYKAAAHNPNLSDEAREKAKEHLQEMGVDENEKADTKNRKDYSSHAKDLDLSYKHEGNVIGGYRATLHNPNTSEEAKEHARKMLKEMGVDPEGHADSQHRQKSPEEIAEDSLGKNQGNVIGGYRATLHNPKVSDEAKDHAKEVLEEMGVDPEGQAESTKQGPKEADTRGKNPNNVAGGYKATLKNPNVSEDAKENAKEQLENLGIDADESSESSRKTYKEADTQGKNKNNVIGGYKATLHNDKVSDEAKENAKQQLEKMGADADEKVDSSKKSSSKADTEGKNPNNVAGGYKATLKNPNASEEAKENAKEQLKNLAH